MDRHVDGYCSFFDRWITNSRSIIFLNSSFLDSRSSILDLRFSNPVSRNLNIFNFAMCELHFKERVETVNWPLSSTVSSLGYLLACPIAIIGNYKQNYGMNKKLLRWLLWGLTSPSTFSTLGISGQAVDLGLWRRIYSLCLLFPLGCILAPSTWQFIRVCGRWP